MKDKKFAGRDGLPPVMELRTDVHSKWIQAMRRGDFEAAWRQTDRIEIPRRRLERTGEFTLQPHHLLWNGEPLANRHVVIRCNHGLGDTLQFLCFVPRLAKIARTVTVLVQPPLVRLLCAHPGFGEVRNGWTEEPPSNDCIEIEIMELAYAFRATRKTLPRVVPYLDHKHVQTLTQPLPHFGNAGALRVGLLWAASDWDPSRSIQFAALEPLRDVAGAQFYSLQQGEAEVESDCLQMGMVSLSAHTRAIEEAAAALLELDLLITVDSMLAHLAGALGRPVWLLLKENADWRWMQHSRYSHWYPTMRVFRQRDNQWDSVVNEVACALRRNLPVF